MKLKTIDDVCGLPKGSFTKFIKNQEELVKQTELKRKERIRKQQ